MICYIPSEAYIEPSQTCIMKLFMKIVPAKSCKLFSRNVVDAKYASDPKTKC